MSKPKFRSAVSFLTLLSVLLAVGTPLREAYADDNPLADDFPFSDDYPLVSLVLDWAGTGLVGTPEDQGDITVSATMSIAAVGAVEVTISVAPANYNASEFATEDDYSVSDNKLLTFAEGQTASTGLVTITPVDDNIASKSRRLRVTGTVTGNALMYGYKYSQYIEFVIYDNEPPPTKTLFVNPNKISEDGGVSYVTVELSHATTYGDVLLDVQTGTLPAGAPRRADSTDFELSDNIRLVIPAGKTESTGTVTVTAIDNDVVGPSAVRRLGVRARNKNRLDVPTEPGSYTNWTLLVIEEDDFVLTGFGPFSGATLDDVVKTVSEGDKAVFELYASQAPTEALDVIVVLSDHHGVLAAGESGQRTVTIPAGATMTEVELRTVDDTDVNAEKRHVQLMILASERARPVGPTSDGLNRGIARLNVEDNDEKPKTPPPPATPPTPALPTVNLSVSPTTVVEGESVTVTVTLSTTISSTTTIPLTLTPGTAEPEDYGDLESITIVGGQSSGSDTIGTNRDDDADNETFTVALGDLPPAVTAGESVSALVAIHDVYSVPPSPLPPPAPPPPPPLPTVKLSVSPTTVLEGESVTVTATLSATISSPTTIPLELIAVSAEPEDYGELESITIVGGQLSGSGTLDTTRDDDADHETFVVVLDDLPADVTAGEPAAAHVTIRDVYSVPPTPPPSQPPPPPATPPTPALPLVNLAVSPTTVLEGESVTVTVTLSESISSTATIPLTLTPGTAEPEDYGALASITIVGGQTSGSGTIATNLDDDIDNETFTVALGDLPPAVTAGESVSVQVAIRDVSSVPPPPPQPPPPPANPPIPALPKVNLSVSPTTVDEGESVTVTATLSKAMSSTLTVPLTLTAISAEPDDFGELASITIDGGQISGSGTITTVQDDDMDDDAFMVALGHMPPDVSEGEPTSVQVMIRDRTLPPNRPPSVSLSCDPCTVTRGGMVNLTATASDPDNDPLKYSWSNTLGSFEGPTDNATARFKAPTKPGVASVAVEVSDGRGGTASAKTSIKAVNRAPAFGRPAYVFELPENADGARQALDLGGIAASDPDGDTLAYELTSGDLTRFRLRAGDAILSYIGRGEDFEAKPNRFELNARARDAYGAEASTRVTIKVIDIDERPTAADDVAETLEDEPVTVTVLANDSDPDGDSLSVVSVTAPAHGVNRIGPNDRVIYTPNANWHGTDLFSYTVADPGGGTATANVRITVQAVNDAPTPLRALPDRTLDEGGDAVDVNLAQFFEDLDGDALNYRAESSNSDAVIVRVSSAVLTMTPKVYGSALVTVTAEDSRGLAATQIFTATVDDRLVRAVLGDTLATMARARLASAQMMLQRRVDTGGGDSWLTVMGQPVPLDKAGVSGVERQLLAEVLSSLIGRSESEYDLPGERTTSYLIPGDDMPSYADHPSSATRRYDIFSDGSDTLLRATEFQLTLGDQDAADGADGGRWWAWGQGDLQVFGGKPKVFDYGGRYDGGLRSAYLGVDGWLSERWMAGVAVSRSTGTSDWEAGSATGRLSSTLTTLYPYARWSDERTEFWAMLGAGGGEAKNVRDVTALEGTSNLDARLGLVEVRRQIGATDRDLQVAVRADIGWSQLRTGDGQESVDRLSVAVDRQRIGVEASRPFQHNEWQVEPFGEVHLRSDGGSGQTGKGMELAGGVRLVSGLMTIDVFGRTLAVHSAAGYKERGAGVAWTVSDLVTRGSKASLSLVRGADSLGTGAMWRERLQPIHAAEKEHVQWTTTLHWTYRGARLRWIANLTLSETESGFLIGISTSRGSSSSNS